MTGTVFLGANEYSVREGEPYVTVTFQRTGDNSGAVQVNYATSAGTATQGVDYPGSSGIATIAAGANSVNSLVFAATHASVPSSSSIRHQTMVSSRRPRCLRS